MSKLYTGKIGFSVGIAQTGAVPLDDRSVVASFSDLLNTETFGLSAYEGMLVAVVEDKQVYMLTDKANSTLAESWVPVGATGKGTQTVNTYEEAVSLANTDNLGQIIFVTGETLAYVVIGEGTLMKLASSTAGNIDDIVNSLQSRVSALEALIGGEEAGLAKDVANLQSAVETKADADAVEAAFEAVNAEIATKADAETVNTELAKKVDVKVYEAKVANLEAAIKALPDFDIVVVEELPLEVTNDKVIYLVQDKNEPRDLYTEYIYVNGVWENLGKQEIDLTDYLKGVKVNGVTANVENNVASIDVDGAHIKLGAKVTVDGNPDNGLEGDASNVKYDEETYLSTVLQGIYLQIKQAEAGGINSITAGNTSIAVNATDLNNPTVRVNTEEATESTVADGHIELVAGVNGLYGIMYYDGNDAE